MFSLNKEITGVVPSLSVYRIVEGWKKVIKTILKTICAALLILMFLATKYSYVLAETQSTEIEAERLIQAESILANEKETEILVQYKPGSRDKRSLSSTDGSLLVKKTVSTGPDILIVTPQDGVDSSSVIEKIRKDSSVIRIEKNIKRKLHTIPNDPGYVDQWGLKTIRAEKAWTNMSPSKKSIIVAVIDSGVELSHSDLQDKVIPGGYNFILGSDYIYDENGHGTVVSGIIAAKTNNGLGIAGVVGTVDVRILPLQVANYAGDSYLSDVIRAIDYAIAKGADVINLSLGSNSYSAVENDAVQRAIQAGVTVIASAGNDGNSLYSFPASYDNVISVGAIDRTEQVSNFSNFNDKVTVVAPGEDIYSCSLYNSYSNHSGTSFSAPMVTGIAAVLRAIEPSIQPKEVKHILETSAQDRGEIGWDYRYGYGIANMDDAIKQVSYIPVDGISLEPANLRQAIGETKTLIVSFIPLKASIQTLSWISDNSAVAEVDERGVVSAVGIGQALIIAISEDGGKTATCNVTVENEEFNGILWVGKDSVSSDKKWRIVFNAPLEDDGIRKGAIYVIDEQGEEYPTEMTIGNERNEVSIGPKEAYQSGKTYYLMISDRILSKSGKPLAKAVKMKFAIR